MSARSHRGFADRWRRLRTVPGLGKDVAAFAVVVALGIVAAGYLMAHLNLSLPWADRYVVKAEVAEAPGVSPSTQQEVRIAGVKVGKIIDSVPTARNTSVLTLSLEPGHPIYDNARLVYRPRNPLNQMYVNISPGGPPGRVLPDGGLIPIAQTVRPVQVDEALIKLDDRSRAALTNLLAQSDNALANAPQSLPAGLAAADATVVKLRPVVERLQVRHDNIERLITGVQQLVSGLGRNDVRLTSVVDSLEQTLGVVSQRNDQLGRTLRELPDAADAARHALASTSNLTRELNPTLDDLQGAAEELPDALSALKDAAGPLRDTADAARPVVDKARSVLSDLRPTVRDLHESFDNIEPVTACADEYTEKIAPWMYDLGAFFYNDASIFNSLDDANGRVPRGHLTVNAGEPLGAQRIGESESNTYQDAPSVTTGLPYPRKGSGECR
jgi:phospholipid/cholesterol/gamma-HCH transport system substrate-binding protein